MKQLSIYAATIAMSVGSAASQAEDLNVYDQLADVKGVQSIIEEPCGDYVNYEAQCFTIMMEQPVDHIRPWGEKFEQRIRIIHRGFDAPVALRTRGYNVYDDSAPFKYYPIEPTTLIEGNLIDVEHRYFGASKPAAPLDWSKLTIFQAATDMHKLVKRLRSLYSENWVAFGYSKGGMTSTYFRNFYPNDVTATVPYVAPLSFGRADARYKTFLNEVGTAECRKQVLDFQRDVLSRKGDMVSALDRHIEGKETATRWPHGTPQALEYLVGEYGFFFWQYGNGLADCDLIPKDGVEPAVAIQYLDDTLGIDGFMDSGFSQWESYYWQALTQLGYGGLLLEPLSDLLEFNPEDYLVYAPENVDVPRHKFFPMFMMHLWAKYGAERVMYVYGDFDPYTAAAYPLAVNAKENEVYRFNMAEGNHGARIGRLSEEDKIEASNILREWMGLKPLEEKVGIMSMQSVNTLTLPEPPLER